MTTPGTTSTTGTVTAAPRATTRLRNGELRRMVAEQLANDPTTAFTPGTIANKLGGRSSGAVGNALATLEARGEAEKVGTTPVTGSIPQNRKANRIPVSARYRITAGVIGAIAAPVGGGPARLPPAARPVARIHGPVYSTSRPGPVAARTATGTQVSAAGDQHGSRFRPSPTVPPRSLPTSCRQRPGGNEKRRPSVADAGAVAPERARRRAVS